MLIDPKLWRKLWINLRKFTATGGMSRRQLKYICWCLLRLVSHVLRLPHGGMLTGSLCVLRGWCGLTRYVGLNVIRLGRTQKDWLINSKMLVEPEGRFTLGKSVFPCSCDFYRVKSFSFLTKLWEYCWSHTFRGIVLIVLLIFTVNNKLNIYK